MIYRALIRFCDRQDDMFMYEAGDTYPRPGLDVTPERIAELAGSDNRMGYPLIKRAETPVEPGNDKQPKETPTEPPRPAQRGRRSRKKE